MSKRTNFLFRSLSSRPGMIAMAFLTGLAWHHTVGASPITDAGEPVVLPMAGLATPVSNSGDGDSGYSSTVLAPSCATHDGSACTRLAEICERLSGDMRANGDGSQTCLIVVE